ncbi:MAG: phosphohydrolase [Gemmatimonadota bacterium]|nr:MAG: phosphohydrolase [Gemmatimonadota bacterium]
MASSSPQNFDLDRFKQKKTSSPGGEPAAPATGGSAQVQTAPGPRVQVVAKERRTQAILASIETLPSLPSVVTDVLRLANDPDASASDFEAIIRKDQALTAKVLRLVNSPFFGLKRSVESIPQAIVVLGMKSLRSVVLAARTSRLLDRQLTPYGLASQGLWQHSISCAMLGSDLAQRLKAGQAAQEAVFVGGLLHDVGKVVLAPHLATEQPAFGNALRESPDLCAVETEFLGMSHAEAGARMGRHWDLPDSLVRVIERHHVWADPDPADLGLALVRLANELCNQLGVGLVAGPVEPSPDWERLMSGLDLPAGDVLREECRARLEELAPTFQEMAAH